MKIVYSPHLTFRLKYRSISRELPKIIYEKSSEKYFDRNTKSFVAIGRNDHRSDKKEYLVAYRKTSGLIILITIHPIKTGQKLNRIRSKRWQKL